jgi:hypothetical protein
MRSIAVKSATAVLLVCASKLWLATKAPTTTEATMMKNMYAFFIARE